MGSAVFTIIFGKIANLSTDGHPAFLFYLVGNLSWQFFGGVFGIGSNALQSNHNLFSKVYFPRIIPPIAQSFTIIINLMIHLFLFGISIYIYKYSLGGTTSGPNLWILIIPLLVLQTLALGLGLGFIVSSMSVKYRDFGRLTGLMTQFIMYASPVIYPLSLIPDKYKFLSQINPLTFIVESYRFSLLGSAHGFTMKYAITSIGITIVILFIGIIFYNKIQRSYVDYV